MLHERRKQIIEKIKQNRMIKVTDLMEEHDVSIETIRRDLEHLEKQGILRRVYGGAVAVGMYGQEPDYTFREVVNYDEKKAIGARAAELINDGDTVFVDVGTTTLEAARYLHDKKNLTVITNSTAVAVEMVKYYGCRLILLGGELKRTELSTAGFLCEEGIRHFHVSKALIGTGGISVKWGVTDYHIAETTARRLMIERSDMVIVLADYTKIEAAVMNCVCPIESIHTLVTDWSVSPKLVAGFREAGVNTIVAQKL